MPIQSYEPDGNFVQPPESMPEIPEYLWQAQEEILVHIKRQMRNTSPQTEPKIEFRKHRGEHFIIKIHVKTLDEPIGSISNAPSDRYPFVRRFLRSNVLKRHGLKLSHESETYPYVVLDFNVYIPAPIPWWAVFSQRWF